MISGGSASTTNNSGVAVSSSNHMNNNTTTTTNSTNPNINVDNMIQPQPPQQQILQSGVANSLTSFLTSPTSHGIPTITTTANIPPSLVNTTMFGGEQTSSHIVGANNNTTSLLPPLAKSTPIMTTTTTLLNGSANSTGASSSSTSSQQQGVQQGEQLNRQYQQQQQQFVPIAPATNQHIVQSAHSDHTVEHHTKSIPSNSTMVVSNSIVSSNVPLSQQERPTKPVQIGFMPPISLCVLMEQMATKIHQHYQPQKPTSLSKKSELSSQKKEVGESSSTLNSNTTEEDAKRTESMLTDDKTNSQSNETNANVISTSRNVSSTSQGRSRSPGSTLSLLDILNEECHSNHANYQELIHATNLIVEFLYGNTDLKERYHPLHSQFSSQQPAFCYVYLPSTPPFEQTPPMYPNVARPPPVVANQYSTPVKSATRVATRTDTPSSNFKPTNSSATGSYDSSLEIPPPVFAMPKPSNGSSEASTPMRVRIAPSTGGNTIVLPMSDHQPISPFPIRAKEEDLMEEDKRKRRINKKPESTEGGATGDEQENRFVCYICDKSVVDKSTKYTLTSTNFSSFHEVFPHLKTPPSGESKRICANCYHKKYRNTRKKKADDRKDVISQGSSNVLSVDAQSENYEPTYCCCVCKKNGSDDFSETNFVNSQNYGSYLAYFPFISETPSADRQLPVCDSCHEKFLQANDQEKKRKMMYISNTAETLESLNKKLKPDTSHL